MVESPGKGFVKQTSGGKTRYYNPSTGGHTGWKDSSGKSTPKPSSSSKSSNSSSKKSTVSNWDQLSDTAKESLSKQGYGPKPSSSTSQTQKWEVESKNGKYRLVQGNKSTAWRTAEEWEKAEVAEEQELAMKRKLAEEQPEEYTRKYVGNEGLLNKVPAGAEKVSVDPKKGTISYIPKDEADAYKQQLISQNVPSMTSQYIAGHRDYVEESYEKKTGKKVNPTWVKTSYAPPVPKKKSKLFYNVLTADNVFDMVNKNIPDSIKPGKKALQEVNTKIGDIAEEKFLDIMGLDYEKGSPQELAKGAKARVENQVLKDWEQRRAELIDLKQSGGKIEDFEKADEKWNKVLTNNVNRVMSDIDKDIKRAEPIQRARTIAASPVRGIAELPGGFLLQTTATSDETKQSITSMGEEIYKHPEMALAVVGTVAGQAAAMGAISYSIPKVKGYLSRKIGKARSGVDVGLVDGDEALKIGVREEFDPVTKKNIKYQTVKGSTYPEIKAYSKKGKYYVDFEAKGVIDYASEIKISSNKGYQLFKGKIVGDATVYKSRLFRKPKIVSKVSPKLDLTGSAGINKQASIGSVKTKTKLTSGNKIVSETYYTKFSSDVLSSNILETGKGILNQKVLYQTVQWRAITSAEKLSISKPKPSISKKTTKQLTPYKEDGLSIDGSITKTFDSKRYEVRIPKKADYNIQQGFSEQLLKIKKSRIVETDMFGNRYTEIGFGKSESASIGATYREFKLNEWGEGFLDITPATIRNAETININIKNVGKKPNIIVESMDDIPETKFFKPTKKPSGTWDTSFLKSESISKPEPLSKPSQTVFQRDVVSANLKASTKNIMKNLLPETSTKSIPKTIISPVKVPTVKPTISFEESSSMFKSYEPASNFQEYSTLTSKKFGDYRVGPRGSKFGDFQINPVKSGQKGKQSKKQRSKIDPRLGLVQNPFTNIKINQNINENINVKINPKISQKIGQGVNVNQNLKQKSTVKTKSILDQVTKQRYTFNYPSITVTPRTFIPVPPLPIFRTGMSTSFKKSNKSTFNIPSKYTASLVAKEFNTFSTKPPKFLTGIERRPLIRKSKKQKTRKGFSMSLGFNDLRL